MKKEDRLITEQEAQDNSLLFKLAWSLHKKDGFLSKFKAGRYHANPTHTYFSFLD